MSMRKHICKPKPTEWHDWFSWYPVCVKTESPSPKTYCYERVWLETIERRIEFSMYDTWKHYRLKASDNG